MKRLLLLDTTKLGNTLFMSYCSTDVKKFLGSSIETVLFIPYACPSGMTYAQYTKLIRPAFEKMGYHLHSIHEAKNPRSAINDAEAIFVGGGNSFMLLNQLYKTKVLDILRKCVRSGTPYIGASAGSNLAGPTIMTTNDMPICEVPSMKALGLVPFQWNPHYPDKQKGAHKYDDSMRDVRLKEFLTANNVPVIASRKGSIVLVEGKHATVKGSASVRLFKKGKKPKDYKPGSSLDFLLR